MAEAFTEEQVQAIKEVVNPIINGAVAAINKTLKSDREALSTGILKSLDEKLQALKPPEGGGGGEGGEGGKGGKGKNLELDTLRKQISDASEAIRTANERTAKAESRRREIERSSLVDGRLAKSGIQDPFMRELAQAHFDRKGRVVWSGDDEEAAVVWKGDDGVEVGFEEGFAGWLKSEEAKRFLPASGKGGSGSRPGNGGRLPEQKKEPTYEDVGHMVLGLTQGGQGSL